MTLVRPNHKLEVRDSDGDLKRVIHDVATASLDQSVNNPAVVSLTCPISPQIAAALTDLDRPNAIWVWQDDVLKFAGPISLTKITHSQGLKSIQIDALDYFASLKQEYVTYYDGNDSVSDHITAILAQQVSTTPVLLGTIEPIVDRDITIEQAYIYESLINLRDTVGGYLQVDPYRKLNWYWAIATSTGQQVRYKKNLTGMTKSVDWLNFGNRLYIYGDGCDLMDAGMTTLYIEDTDSIAKYGLCVRTIHAGHFTSAATMLAYAQLLISQMSQPRITYTADIVNLADFGLTYEKLELGSWVTLINEEIDVNTDVQIVRLVLDLVKGQNVGIELAAKGLDVCDLIPGNYTL